jgi:hypothetical protein
VTVSVEVPAAAVEAAFNVIVLLPLPGDAIDVGANVAVTPFGSPLTVSASAAAKPFVPTVETCTVNVGPITVRPMAQVCVTPPPDPLTVNVYNPPTVPAAALRVSVLLPLPGAAIDPGANFAVTPLGKPVTESEIADWNPFTAAVLTPTLLELPAVTVAPVLAVRVNVGTITVRLIV